MKRVIAFLLACVICLAALSGCGASNTTTITETTVATETVPVVREAVNTYPAADGFSGGDGTEENPYQISSAAELASSGTVYYAGLFADASGSSDSNMCIQNLNIAESYTDSFLFLQRLALLSE